MVAKTKYNRKLEHEKYFQSKAIKDVLAMQEQTKTEEKHQNRPLYSLNSAGKDLEQDS